MDAIKVYTTRIPGFLLARALRRFGICSGRVKISSAPFSEKSAAEPVAILIQPGGIQALEQLGVSPNVLYKKGARIVRGVIFDKRAKTLLSFDTRQFPAMPAGCSIELEELRTVCAPESFEFSMQAGVAEKHMWSFTPCPGIFLRVVRGELYDPARQIIWDLPGAHIGVAPLARRKILLWSIPKQSVMKDFEESVARTQLDFTLQKRNFIFLAIGDLLYERWFPLANVGYRPSWDGEHLHWGASSLRLHPLTGQFVSYWALQAQWLAREIATKGSLTAELARELDRRNQRMFWSHKRALNYYLKPNVFWKSVFRPYAFAMRHFPFLKRRVIKKLALL
ncbi:MAG: hypothetical protein A3C80_00045 [Candidatus Ryanbacteria bacterium RIFCSPHIGHO2_02_FULL_45_43]|uniref:Uncharacterized protein n=1 Tax=Candidatus Ryanbacteria bacterium RIFCSPHIGHO2_01_45_13 TaxID=1802112 RepID=A0A1G2FVQ3_9BACT|nr:MAG: hypothetical protein A2718_01430 [Candidatus Ryanbacteria bacterium RIFCSPHIGHO2_01_FULL_44_130]OGZ41812.1 MAG: hypothetical protein A2W41_00780 [Candidatus Ryanbacteria bacterium RIFCSPHIGHO2_01_45_13]OGZ47678.1 MAG: hypothetical protein A3C80_00045 [Candidatus Ryanbacteria bacterium RIFCSPHIGHO2_02_FULL_45_43]OGZ49575.1 MAG: hypothetical protein A3E55_04050 [Candidatus Ryanbacteria bacterium RIFCSPHIGHO2_12_FULL_44_20]OGZ53997.1 MAG: hypothetical protein A3H62_03265 [Candidatus Ryanba